MRAGALFLVALFAWPAVAVEPVTIAVASNFYATATELSTQFSDDTGIVVRVSNGSTGKLYAQILNGAPFDVFLSADAERPALLEKSGHAVADSRFTYAQGVLVLWSRDATDCLAVLQDANSGRVAIANPETAPYGRAAVEYLSGAGIWNAVSERVVYGENIAQAMQFAATGNATIGLVAKSQLRAPQLPEPACTWEVPVSSHSNLEQQAILLARAAANNSARRFYDFLRSDEAREIVRRHGYELTP